MTLGAPIANWLPHNPTTAPSFEKITDEGAATVEDDVMNQEVNIDPSDSSLFWSYDKHAERVHPLHTALDNYFYDCEWDDVEPLEVITMYAFKQKVVNEKQIADFVLGELIERFDDEYGDPEEETKVTQKMKDAALDFVRAVVAECDAWQVEDVGSVELKVSDWR